MAKKTNPKSTTKDDLTNQELKIINSLRSAKEEETFSNAKIKSLEKIRDRIIQTNKQENQNLIKQYYDIDIARKTIKKSISETTNDFLKEIETVTENVIKAKTTPEYKQLQEKLENYKTLLEKEKNEPLLFPAKDLEQIEAITKKRIESLEGEIKQKIESLDKETKQRNKFTSKMKKFAQRHGFTATGVVGALTAQSPLALFAASVFQDWRNTKRDRKETQAKEEKAKEEESVEEQQKFLKQAYSNKMYAAEENQTTPGSGSLEPPIQAEKEIDPNENQPIGAIKIRRRANPDVRQTSLLNDDMVNELKLHTQRLDKLVEYAEKRFNMDKTKELFNEKQELLNNETLDNFKSFKDRPKEKTSFKKPEESKGFLSKLLSGNLMSGMLGGFVAGGGLLTLISTILGVAVPAILSGSALALAYKGMKPLFDEEERKRRQKEAKAKGISEGANNVGYITGTLDTVAKLVGLEDPNKNIARDVGESVAEHLPQIATGGIVPLTLSDMEASHAALAENIYSATDSKQEIEMRNKFVKILAKNVEQLSILQKSLAELQKTQDNINDEYEKQLKNIEQQRQQGKLSPEKYEAVKQRIQQQHQERSQRLSDQVQRTTRKEKALRDQQSRLETQIQTPYSGPVPNKEAPTPVGPLAVPNKETPIGQGKEPAASGLPTQLAPAGNLAPQTPKLNSNSWDASGRSNTTESKSQSKGKTEIQQNVINELNNQGITDPRAQANILAQIKAESNFRPRSEEISKEKADADYAKLGGHEYRGRGLIQLTGKENYERYGKQIGVDLVNNPNLANDPEIAARIAGAYYADRGKGKDLTDIQAVNKMTGYSSKVNAGLKAGTGGPEDMKRAAYAKEFLNNPPTLTNNEVPQSPESQPTQPLMLAKNEVPQYPESQPTQPLTLANNEVPQLQLSPTTGQTGQQLSDLQSQYTTSNETIQTQAPTINMPAQGGGAGTVAMPNTGAPSNKGSGRSKSDPLNSPNSGLNVVV